MVLRRSDLIVSMLRLYWQEASELLPRFVKEINDGGNIKVDNDFVIRCMFSTAGMGTRLDFELLRKRSNVDEIKRTYKCCFDSIRSCIDFVRAQCSIDSARLLGGISTLVPLVHYLFHAPQHIIAKGNEADARRAVFLFAFAKPFTQLSESRTGAFIRNYLPPANDIMNGEPFPFNGVAEYVSEETGFHAPDGQLFNNNVELALSLIQGRTGGKIQLPANQPEIDHIFPRSALEEKGFDPSEINDLGNLWILPGGVNKKKCAKHPSEFFRDVDDGAMQVAFIDRSLLDYRSVHPFIRGRREKIVAALNNMTGLTPEQCSFLSEGEEEA